MNPTNRLAIARAAGQDAAERRMKSEGRTTWNTEDWNHAAAVCEQAYPTAEMLGDMRREIDPEAVSFRSVA